MKIVIIGGDAAGMSAASEARRRAPHAEVVVLEATQDVSYGACGLPYKLADAAKMEDLVILTADRFRKERGIDVRLGHRATRIDPVRHVVEGESDRGAFEVRYDKLLIATGAQAIRPPIDGVEELWGNGVFALKTLDDGRLWKRALASNPRSVAIVGGGYIGLEAAENLRERGMAVTILEALPVVAPFLTPAGQQQVLAEAAQHGVEVRSGARVDKIQRRADGKIGVSTAAGDLTVDIVLMAVGVRPNTDVVKGTAIALSVAGSIRVDEQLRTSEPDILAAGDVADAEHAVTGARVWIPLALRANRAGKLAGRHMTGETVKAPPVLGTAVFKFFGLQVARTGLRLEEAKAAGFDAVQAEVTSGTRAKYYPGGGKLLVSLVGDRATGRLLGGTMVGPESAAHRIDTLAAAIHARQTADQLYDMDLGYAPPYGPSWSPLLVAASQLSKELGGQGQ